VGRCLVFGRFRSFFAVKISLEGYFFMEHFLHQALIFIAISLVLVPLFKGLGFGPVLGFLLAGVSIGPFTTKLIDDAESVMHFSELGVVMLLFMIGLEMSPRKLWGMKQDLFGLGVMQIVLTTAVFTLIGHFLFSLPSITAVVIAFALSLSSTAFALQTLIEKKVLHTPAGKASFSVLLMQDLLAIPALAFIPSLGPKEGSSTSPSALMVMGALVLLIIVGRFFVRPFLRFVAKTRSPEIFTIAALFIVFGVSTLMLALGLSAALGAFIAGVLLAESEYRHELEANLAPFKGLLMGLFFIGVGMNVNISLVLEKPLVIFLGTLLYLAIKSFLLYACARVNRLDHETAKLVALNIGQGGEFAFVILGMSVSLALLPGETGALVVAMITLSMMLNPLFMILSERFRRQEIIEKKYDAIKDETPKIIIAGFGRFGQTFGRILRSQNIPFVAIDHSAEHIDMVRKFGNKVYYGDASRQDILHSAGAESAEYIIVAVDDPEASLDVVRHVQEHFPHLKIFARARNRNHYYELMELGVLFIKREMFDSSLNFVRDLFMAMGHSKEKVDLMVERFQKHDELMLLEQFKVRNDDKMYVSLVHQSTLMLEKVLSEDQGRSYVDFTAKK
jgi:monovalent cation:proton antiporter-2 (CPA2) family protein